MAGSSPIVRSLSLLVLVSLSLEGVISSDTPFTAQSSDEADVDMALFFPSANDKVLGLTSYELTDIVPDRAGRLSFPEFSTIEEEEREAMLEAVNCRRFTVRELPEDPAVARFALERAHRRIETSNATSCDELPKLEKAPPSEQVAWMKEKNHDACGEKFFSLLLSSPERWVDAFMDLVSYPPVGEALFLQMYNNLVRSKSNVLPMSVVETMMDKFPPAIEKLDEGLKQGGQLASRRNSTVWNQYIVSVLPKSVKCPKNPEWSSVPRVLKLVDLTCVESIAGGFEPNMETLDKMVSMLNQTKPGSQQRRNVLRVLNRLIMRPSINKGLVSRVGQEIRPQLITIIKSDPSADVLDDAVIFLDTAIGPDDEIQGLLESLFKNSTYMDSHLLFATFGFWERTLFTKPICIREIEFLASTMNHPSKWVRRKAPQVVVDMKRRSLLTQEYQAILEPAMTKSFSNDTILLSRIATAWALDSLGWGNPKSAAFSFVNETISHFNHTKLRNVTKHDHITIQSGIDTAKHAVLAKLMNRVRESAFFVLPLETFTKEDPPSSPPPATAPSEKPSSALEPNQEMLKVELEAGLELLTENSTNEGDNHRKDNPITLVVFANVAEYADFMDSIIGYGASAGGLYLKDRQALYTYDRSRLESVHTLEELVQHEYGHHVMGQYVFHGKFTDESFHKEPKGWADEGFGEFLGGLVFNDTSSCFSLPPRQAHMNKICAAKPLYSLKSLLEKRDGYSESGTFEYAFAWSFLYYLAREKEDVLKSVFTAFSKDTYKLSEVHKLFGVSVADMEKAWHEKLTSWCKTPPPLKEMCPKQSTRRKEMDNNYKKLGHNRPTHPPGPAPGRDENAPRSPKEHPPAEPEPADPEVNNRRPVTNLRVPNVIKSPPPRDTEPMPHKHKKKSSSDDDPDPTGNSKQRNHYHPSDLPSMTTNQDSTDPNKVARTSVVQAASDDEPEDPGFKKTTTGHHDPQPVRADAATSQQSPGAATASAPHAHAPAKRLFLSKEDQKQKSRAQKSDSAKAKVANVNNVKSSSHEHLKVAETPPHHANSGVPSARKAVKQAKANLRSSTKAPLQQQQQVASVDVTAASVAHKPHIPTRPGDVSRAVGQNENMKTPLAKPLQHTGKIASAPAQSTAKAQNTANAPMPKFAHKSGEVQVPKLASAAEEEPDDGLPATARANWPHG